MQLLTPRCLAILLLMLINVGSGAQTTVLGQTQNPNDYQQATSLYRLGQSAKAIERVDAWLKVRPKDARGRFLKGMILVQQNKNEDALKVYTELTQDFPELPEPYNNLAVIHAGLGDFERALGLLESAVRANPSFAAAHENLGDIHARLAAQAYERALKLDPRNTLTAGKFKTVSELVPIRASIKTPAVQSTP